MEEDDIDIPTIKQGNPKDNQVPTFQDTLNNYDQLLFNREGSLKPDRYSLIDEIKEGDIGGELNQNIDQFFRNKWEGLGPENQDLILQGIDTIQKGKELTKSNWKKYPIESSLWHAIDFIGAVAGPIYQAGTTVTANVGERAFGINRELIEKANTINQIRTGKVFPFLPNRVPGVNLRPKDIGISSRIEKITPLTSGKQMWNITDQINDLMSQPPSYLRKVKNYYSHHEGVSLKEAARMAKLMDFTTGSLRKNSLFKKGKKNIMYSTGVDPVPDEWELIKWSNYGYTPDTQPTQVSKASPLFVEQVANSLDSFYSRTQEAVISKVGSKASAKEIRQALKEFPQFWVNPEGGKIYRASYTTGLQKRYTIKPVARQFLEKQQSTALQKKWNSWFQKDIQTRNKLHKEAYDKEFDATQKELKEVQKTIEVYRKKGESGPDMQRALDRITELNTKIDNLEYGREYTEHGLYLQSEKGRNYILDNSGVPLNESKEFSLGDIDNQTARLENLNNPDTLVFRKFKSRLETVLDESPGNYFSYPNYIVNSNPRLSGGRDDVIRIEYSPIEWQEVPGTDQMRPVLSDFKIKDGILSGKNVNVKTIDIKKDLPSLKEYFSRGFNDETIRQWLSEVHGITPVSQDQSIPRTGFNIRLSKSPMKSRQEQIKEFKKLMEDVQAGRKTWDEVFAEEGIEIVPQTGDAKVKRSKGGRPKGSRTKVKGEKGETFLDKLNNAFKGWE